MSTWHGIVSTIGLLVATAVWAADVVAIEDWSQYPVGAKGLPRGWEAQQWGSPAYDFTVVADGGTKVLHLKSHNEGSTIAKPIKGKVDLKQTPILEWRWKAITLPKGGDSRHKATDDQACQVYLGWERFPKQVRSQLIGYVWDTTAPAGTIAKSEKTGTVTYLIVRSGAADLGKWLTERRNVVGDFKKIYGAAPDAPDVISIAIDTNDTQSTAECFMGPIAFRRP